MVVYVIEGFENIPYGEYMGIQIVFSSYNEAVKYLEVYDDDYYSLSIHEMEVHDESSKGK